MIGVVIAAGRGARMRELTAVCPKCLLQVNGQTLLDHALRSLRRAGCARVIVITGYGAALVRRHLRGHHDVRCLENPGAADVNVLHSLMHARAELDGPALITYGDTYLSWPVFEALLATPGDLVVGVDRDWRAAYHGRTAHPVAEAEKTYFDSHGRALRFGKHLIDVSSSTHEVGEFVGAMRTTNHGTRTLVDTFMTVDATLAPNAPFQAAEHWRLAYLTDLLQECLERGVVLNAAVIERGWLEFDTPEDYERLHDVAVRQRLDFGVPGNG